MSLNYAACRENIYESRFCPFCQSLPISWSAKPCVSYIITGKTGFTSCIHSRYSSPLCQVYKTLGNFCSGLPQQWDDSHICANPPDPWLHNVSQGIMEQGEVDTYSGFNLSLILCQKMIKAAAFICGLLIYSLVCHLTTPFSLPLSWALESIYKIMISVNNDGLIFYFPIFIPFILDSCCIVPDGLPRWC